MQTDKFEQPKLPGMEEASLLLNGYVADQLEVVESRIAGEAELEPVRCVQERMWRQYREEVVKPQDQLLRDFKAGLLSGAAEAVTYVGAIGINDVAAVYNFQGQQEVDGSIVESTVRCTTRTPFDNEEQVDEVRWAVTHIKAAADQAKVPRRSPGRLLGNQAVAGGRLKRKQFDVPELQDTLLERLIGGASEVTVRVTAQGLGFGALKTLAEAQYETVPYADPEESPEPTGDFATDRAGMVSNTIRWNNRTDGYACKELPTMPEVEEYLLEKHPLVISPKYRLLEAAAAMILRSTPAPLSKEAAVQHFRKRPGQTSNDEFTF